MSEARLGARSGDTLTLQLTGSLDSATLAERLADASMGLIGAAHDRRARDPLPASKRPSLR